MEWVILMVIVIAYYSLAEKIKKISDQMPVRRKKNVSVSLDDLVGKYISIEVDGYYETGTKGVLKYYDDTWIAIESINKRQQTEIKLFRILKVLSIDIVDKT